MDKREISRLFEEIGLLLELKGEGPFKSKAYYNAARTIETLTDDVADLVASGRIRELKGIGQALAEKLAELVGTGRLAYYEELKKSVPSGLLEMTAIPGLGPKKITAVWNQLGITTIGELEYACIENRLVSLPGFGQKTQDKIRQGILQLKKRRGYHLFANVIREAEWIVAAVRQSAGVRRAELVGELRRCVEVVRSILILVAADRPQSILKTVQQAEGLAELTLSGSTITGKSSIGVPVSIVVSEELTAHALLAATGSDEHLTALASRAARMQVPWNLMGDPSGKTAPKADSEEALYACLGLPFIPPELREGLDEIATAEAGRLRPLVEAGQVRGIFHNHTTYSDGSASLDEMVAAAKALGYRYIGISDHSQSAFYANGLKEDRIREQHAAIDALRKRTTGIAVFKGIEADILADGAMDYPDEILARFDFVIASVHSRFNLSEEEQTARVLRALANPYVTMLGHPTGRLLLSREGYRIDMRRVIDAARQYGKVVEINANPHRLDLDWRLCRYAKAQGVSVSINPDAHATDGLEDVPFGVNVARKGGLEASDAVNTLGPEEILSALRAKQTT
ncbi:MAG: DNA polymerase/3'-5' exonuclease PolX [Nitrospirae bacterium]|nr:DNA polymerase/3'-5' exonuclease PolX [Nitrospirota bacterium]